MAKRLNKNMVMGLTAVAFVGSTVSGVLIVKSLREADPREHAAKAESFALQGDHDRAKSHFVRAFHISEDPKYLIRAGDMAQLAAQEMDALQKWTQAVTINPDLLEAHEKLLDYYVPIEAWRRAKETAEAILRIDKKNPKALHALGLSLIRLSDQPEGDRQKGLEYLEEARSLAPEVFEYSATLIRSYWTDAAELMRTEQEDAGKQRLTATLDLARSLVEKNPGPSKDAASARALYASRLSADFGPQHSVALSGVIRAHLQNKDRFEEAERLYREAIETAGSDPEAIGDAMTALASYWFDRAQISARTPGSATPPADYYARSADWARQGIDAHRTGFAPYLLLAQIHSNTQQYAKAAAVCEERLALPIDRKGLKAAQAKFNSIALLLFAAEQYVAVASNIGRGTPEFDAAVKKAEQHVDDAVAEFADPDRAGYALHIRGKIRVVQDRKHEAITLFEKAETASNTPRWQNKRWLGFLQAELRQYGAAKEALLEAVRDPRADAATWLALAKVYAQFDELHSALHAVDAALKQSPDLREAVNVKAVLLQKLGRTGEAGEALAGLEKEGQRQPVMMANLLLAEQKLDEAFAVLSEHLAQQPTHEPALRLLLSFAERAGKKAEARALVAKAAQADPSSLAFRAFALGLQDLSDEQRAEEMLKLILETPDDYTRAARLATYYRAKNDHAKAMEEYGKAADLNLKSATPDARQAGAAGLLVNLQGQFVMALEQKLWDQAEDVAKIAAERNVDGAKGNTFRGRYHLARGTTGDAKSEATRQEWDKAAEAFKMALADQPTDSESLIWLGECHYRAERMTEAKACFTRSADINPANFRAHLRLAELAQKEGRIDEFNARLDQCHKLNPEDPWVRAQVLGRQEEKNPEEGIARREAIFKEQPQDMDNVLQLARLYAAAGDAEKAAEFYSTALADAGATRRAVWPAAQFFLRAGEPDRAVQIMSDAVEKADTPELKAAFLMMTGTLHRSVDNVAEADRQFRNAVDLNPGPSTFFGFADHYLGTNRIKEALPWLEKAIEAADKAESPQTDTAQIRRARIDVLLKLNERDAARAAVKEYDSLYPKDPMVFFLNGEVEFAFGEPDKAITSLTRYIEQFPNNPSALYRRAQFYGNSWKWQSAIKDLEDLRAANPDSLGYTPRMLLALAYDLVDRSDLALSELKMLHEQHPENERICREYLSYFLKHDRHAEAVTLATALVNREPDNPIWHRFLGQSATKLNDGAKALESFSRAAELSNYEWRLVAALMETYEQFRNYDAGIRFYLEKLPPERRVPPLVCRYANLLAGAGRKDEAVAAYREALSSPAAFGDEVFVQEVAFHVVRTLGGKATLEIFKGEPNDERLKRANQHLVAFLLDHFDFRKESVAALDSLLSTSDNNEERAGLLVRKGVILEMEKDYEGARQCYEEAAKLNPRNFVVLNNLAYLLSDKLSKPADAVPYAERAAQLSGSAQVIDTLGWTRVQLGQYGQAIGDLSRALLLDPEFVTGHVHRAEAFRRSGRFDEAVQGFETALKLIAGATNPEYIAQREQAETGLQKARERNDSA